MKLLFSLLFLLQALSLQGAVISHLRGQFGNQLFQVAAAVAMAEENHCPVCFPDFNDFNAPHLAGMELEKNFKNLFHRIPNRIDSAFPELIYDATHPEYRPIPYQPNIEIVGYFLSEKFFAKYASLIRKIFSPPEPIEEYLQERYQDILSHPKTVAVHVRTAYADYLKNKRRLTFYRTFLPPDIAFYRKAIKEFDGDSLFVIFSDYMPWVKKQFHNIPGNFVFIEGQDYLHDFFLMTKCKNAIISNSTFGWWGAYLMENPQKKVICRRPFMAIMMDQMPRDIICLGWIPLDMPERQPPFPLFD